MYKRGGQRSDCVATSMTLLQWLPVMLCFTASFVCRRVFAVWWLFAWDADRAAAAALSTQNTTLTHAAMCFAAFVVVPVGGWSACGDCVLG